MALSRAEILAHVEKPLPTKEVDVPGLGAVRVRRLSGKDKDAFENGNWKVKKDGKREYDPSNYRGRLAALSLCNDAGSRLFEDDDAGMLGDMDGVALDAIVEAAQEHNAMGKEADEEAEKN